MMIKVGLAPPESGPPPPTDEAYSFTFSSATSAVSDKETFQRELSAAIATNRERNDRAAAGPAPPNPTPALAPTLSTPSPIPSNPNNTAPGAMSLNELRTAVLNADPALKSLHYTLCIQTKQVSEAEFWEGREDRIAAAAADHKQRKGRSGEMVDPKPETGGDGEVTVKITPNLIREIFEEYPSVLMAFTENVPTPVSWLVPVRRKREELIRSTKQRSSPSRSSGHATSRASCLTGTGRQIARLSTQSRTTPSLTST